MTDYEQELSERLAEVVTWMWWSDELRAEFRGFPPRKFLEFETVVAVVAAGGPQGKHGVG
jgi:hypothetical protein